MHFPFYSPFSSPATAYDEQIYELTISTYPFIVVAPEGKMSTLSGFFDQLLFTADGDLGAWRKNLGQ